LKLKISQDESISVYLRIAAAVRESVRSGKLRPGDKLPSESSLAAELNLNRLTVSRAYQELNTAGIILQRRGSGSFIAPDAERLARRSVGRGIGRVFVIIGESSLARCFQRTIFLTTDVLEGFSDVIDARDGGTIFIKEMTAEIAATLTEDDVVLSKFYTAGDPAVFADLLRRNIRVISLLDTQIIQGAPRIDYDRHASVTTACRHLIDCGYSRIGYLGRLTHWEYPVSPKFVAYTAALTAAGLDVQSRFLRDVDTYPGRGYAAMRSVLDAGELPEAFFVDTDYKAMEVIGALRDAGLRVPEDVGIVGYDDIPEASIAEPPLTTIHTPRYEIGRRAAEILLNWSHTSEPVSNALLNAKLVVRDSTVSQVARAAATE